MTRIPTKLFFVALVLAAFLPAPLLAQTTNPPYLADMPSVEKVMQAMQTSDPDETAARQMAAFTHLKNMVEKLAGPRFPKSQLTPDEIKYRQMYYTAWWKITQIKLQYQNPLAMRGLDYSVKFRDELIEKCFPPGYAPKYRQLADQAIAQNKAFHEDAEAIRAKRAAEEQAAAQKAFDKLRADYEAKRLQAAQTPAQRALNRCITAGRLPASCMGNTLLSGFTQFIGSYLPALAKQPPPGPMMAGVFEGAGNWRIDFITDGVLVNCSFLSPNQESYSVQFKDGKTYVVLDTTPKPLVLMLTAEGSLVAPGPIEIDGVIASGYHPGTSNAVSRDAAGNRYDSAGHRAIESAGYSTFSSQRTTCPAVNASSRGASVGIETMQTDLLKMVFGGDKGPPTPPGVRMRGVYNAKTGFSVEFYPESVIVSCGEPARAYPYEVVANASQTAIKVNDPSHPLLLKFQSDGSLDPGSGPYLVQGRKIVGQKDDGDFAFTPLEATCQLGLLIPVAPPPPPKQNALAAAAMGAQGAQPSGPTAAMPGKPTGDAVLTIHSGLPGGNGQNPLASVPLVLLRDSLGNILSKSGIQVPAGVSPLLVVATACKETSKDCQTINGAIFANAAGGAPADASGNGTLPGVPAGSYYLMVYAAYNKHILSWDFKVDLKSGANSLTLDQNNAKVAQ